IRANDRSFRAPSANLSCPFQSCIRSMCCCLVSYEDCLVLNGSFTIGDVGPSGLGPGFVGRNSGRLAKDLRVKPVVGAEVLILRCSDPVMSIGYDILLDWCKSISLWIGRFP